MTQQIFVISDIKIHNQKVIYIYANITFVGVKFFESHVRTCVLVS